MRLHVSRHVTLVGDDHAAVPALVLDVVPAHVVAVVALGDVLVAMCARPGGRLPQPVGNVQVLRQVLLVAVTLAALLALECLFL